MRLPNGLTISVSDLEIRDKLRVLGAVGGEAFQGQLAAATQVRQGGVHGRGQRYIGKGIGHPQAQPVAVIEHHALQGPLIDEVPNTRGGQQVVGI